MFFPLKDDNPTRTTPYVTFGLIIINCLVYLYSITGGSQSFQMFIYQFGLIPVELTHAVEVTPQIPAPAYLTPLTSMFMHGGFMHLAGNMLYLWIFGNNIEDYLGKVKFLFFYILSGLAAALLFIVFDPGSQVPLVGASGAIAGVLGAYLVLFPNHRILTLIFLFYFIRLMHIPAKVVLIIWFVYQLFMSVGSLGAGAGGGVAWLAHVGGFAFGWLVLRFVLKPPRPKWS